MNLANDPTPAPAARRAATLAAWLIALLALAAIASGLWRLQQGSAGVITESLRVAEVPVTVFRLAASAGPAPVVVIAHGFAGSQQLMQPYALTLARNGYIAVTFDFPGHGRNPEPFVAQIMDSERRVGVLLGALTRVVDFAAGLAGGDGRLALLGHSMAGDILLRYAGAHRDQVAATVLVSPYVSERAPVAAPRDLLFVFGALEPGMLHQSGRAAIAAASQGKLAGPDAVHEGVTYGDLGDGSARRMVLAPGVEHIGVLYGQSGLGAALDWLDAALGHRGGGFLEQRGGALGLLFLGIVALAWPLVRLLPRAATRPLGMGLGWRRLVPAALVPAVLTPLLLRLVPSDYLPILLGDYLALHFGVYGLFTLVVIWYIGLHRDIRADTAALAPLAPPGRTLWPGFVVGTLCAAAYLTLAFALPLDRYITAFLPLGQRAWLVLGILPGTLFYFAADGWLAHGEGAPRAAPVLTRTLFLLSLSAAVALNLKELFFLIIIIPAILAFFLFYGLIGGWLYRRTRHPLVGGLAIGLAFAWSIAVTFPLVA